MNTVMASSKKGGANRNNHRPAASLSGRKAEHCLERRRKPRQIWIQALTPAPLGALTTIAALADEHNGPPSIATFTYEGATRYEPVGALLRPH
jgi:hypothetical protein